MGDSLQTKMYTEQMQGILDFIQQIAVGLMVFGHILSIPFLPQTYTARPTPVSTINETRAATSSTSKLFPVAENVKPAKNPVATSSATQQKPPEASRVGGASERGGASAQEPVTLLPQSVVNDAARAALVNIFCTTKSGGSFNPISGSGVIITKNGVIVTNAHVGQYFLLRDYPSQNTIDCRIRTGSPAKNMYRAELLYLPPAWITANASQIVAQKSMGTGEDDYAFLRITSPIDVSKPLPAGGFPALTMTINDPTLTEPVLLAAYPAGFLSGITIEMSLYISTALTQIRDIFAFDDRGNADLISLGGSVVAQAGSSGGAVVRRQDGSLHAIIATETETASSTSTAARDLHAITLRHIDRSLREAGMGGIAQLLTGNLQAKAADFASTTAPLERQKLIDALNKR